MRSYRPTSAMRITASNGILRSKRDRLDRDHLSDRHVGVEELASLAAITMSASATQWKAAAGADPVDRGDDRLVDTSGARR